jgi:hypothetical protein
VLDRGVTIVVCPLLSLMQDQVKALNHLPSGGVPTTFLSSQQGQTEAKAVWKELFKARPTVKLLYVTPEQLVKSNNLSRWAGERWGGWGGQACQRAGVPASAGGRRQEAGAGGNGVAWGLGCAQVALRPVVKPPPACPPAPAGPWTSCTPLACWRAW